jgi:hypothetical protein
MLRFTSFNRVTCPSTCPLLHFEVTAATAAASRRNPAAKSRNSRNALVSAAASQRVSACPSRVRTTRWNSATSGSAIATSEQQCSSSAR